MYNYKKLQDKSYERPIFAWKLDFSSLSSHVAIDVIASFPDLISWYDIKIYI